MLCRRRPALLKPEHIEEAVTWIVVGIILGGRLGYVLFYNPAYYLADPVQALYVWRGGMSFHGGLAGVLLALLLFARRRGISYCTLYESFNSNSLVNCCVNDF